MEDIQNILHLQMHCTCFIRPPPLKPPVKDVVFETGISVRLVDQESLAGIFSQDSPGTMMIGLLIWRIQTGISWIYGMSGMTRKKVPPGFFL